MTGSIIVPDGNKIKLKQTKITGSIIGPANRTVCYGPDCGGGGGLEATY